MLETIKSLISMIVVLTITMVVTSLIAAGISLIFSIEIISLSFWAKMIIGNLMIILAMVIVAKGISIIED